MYESRIKFLDQSKILKVMNALTADSASAIRLLIFLLVFSILAFSELIWPRRHLSSFRSQRWIANIGLSILNSLVVRLLIPIAGVGTAFWAESNGIGLFNHLPWPLWIELIVFVLVFDLTIYWQHRVFHWIPLLWRFHRVHHTDEDYDITTGSRFHPISILISAVLKVVLVILMGASAFAILFAEVILNLTSMFNHGNIRLPRSVDKALRYAVVTPDMHRIHHSQDSSEHNQNFGFNFTFWDRLFGSYIENSKQPQESMPIGISGYTGIQTRNLWALILQPVKQERL